ncbi:hypothetical protein HDU76_004848 [Blyttiomyces sp. JEL0837]|nr:hypothetical protein HDU76_004848 [Blyttiomyces sp. JEL0837]
MKNNKKVKKTKKGGGGGRAKKERVELISFDDSARRDYLTGFHKRNLEKKKRGEEIRKLKEKEERRALRLENRKNRQEFVEDLDEIEAISAGKTTAKNTEADSKVLKSKQKVVTVTVQAFDDDNDEEPAPKPSITPSTVKKQAPARTGGLGVKSGAGVAKKKGKSK